MPLKVVVTGGGTGGHIYPALAVAEAVRRMHPDAEVRYIGGKSGMETEIVPATGLPFHAVTSRKLRKVVSPSTVGVLFALLRGYREAAGYLREFAPDAVVSTGGYVAAATALAAARQGIPTLLQSQDVVPGRTNLWLSRWATRLCIWFAESAEMYAARGYGAKVVQTGVPIRRGVVSETAPKAARQAFGLHEDRYTVLVLGGSQGAQRLNEIVLETAPLLAGRVQWLHQTGVRNLAAVQEAAAARNLTAPEYVPQAFFDAAQVPLAYRAADVTVCRCGVSTLAEITANGLTGLLVPLPTAYADHQTANARAMVRAGAGIHLPQAELTAEMLRQQIESLRTDPAQQHRLAEASRAFGRPDAADRVAALICERL